jgi:hypothetical protein
MSATREKLLGSVKTQFRDAFELRKMVIGPTLLVEPAVSRKDQIPNALVERIELLENRIVDKDDADGPMSRLGFTGREGGGTATLFGFTARIRFV